MSDSDAAIEWGLKRSEAELKDLERLWKYLDWQERDDSMQYALSLTQMCLMPPEDMPLPEISDEAGKRLQMVEDKVNELDALNAKDRQTGQASEEIQKPDLNRCMYKITALSDDQMVELGKTMGIVGIDQLQGNRYRLLAMFMSIGKGSTKAMFYAFRNLIGKTAR
jgi:hypothetical protein